MMVSTVTPQQKKNVFKSIADDVYILNCLAGTVLTMKQYLLADETTMIVQ